MHIASDFWIAAVGLASSVHRGSFAAMARNIVSPTVRKFPSVRATAMERAGGCCCPRSYLRFPFLRHPCNPMWVESQSATVRPLRVPVLQTPACKDRSGVLWGCTVTPFQQTDGVKVFKPVRSDVRRHAVFLCLAP